MGSSVWPFAGSPALVSRFFPALNRFIRTNHDVDEFSDTTSARALDIQVRLPSQQLSAYFRIPFGSSSVSVDSDVNCACNEFPTIPLLHQQTPCFYLTSVHNSHPSTKNLAPTDPCKMKDCYQLSHLIRTT